MTKLMSSLILIFLSLYIYTVVGAYEHDQSLTIDHMTSHKHKI